MHIPAGPVILLVVRWYHSYALLEDGLQLALRIAPTSYFTGSKPFTDYVSKLAYSKFPYDKEFFTHNFIHVGHSLGAIHAELNYAYQRKSEMYNNIYSSTFESPASKEIMLRLISVGELSPNSLTLFTPTIHE